MVTIKYLAVEQNSSTAALYRLNVTGQNAGKKVVWAREETASGALNAIARGYKPDRIIIAGAEYNYTDGLTELRDRSGTIS